MTLCCCVTVFWNVTLYYCVSVVWDVTLCFCVSVVWNVTLRCCVSVPRRLEWTPRCCVSVSRCFKGMYELSSSSKVQVTPQPNLPLIQFCKLQPLKDIHVSCV